MGKRKEEWSDRGNFIGENKSEYNLNLEIDMSIINLISSINFLWSCFIMQLVHLLSHSPIRVSIASKFIIH